ncbi:hypothetical protein BKA70DRAFT_1262986 [Coprinopsis sp. MPI-PUGE-AT-0042]|nr:hypothetical protein BKA70DRAFT_1262986 [Coprinopsis sp. MPI-PUGE-AT-0042]
MASMAQHIPLALSFFSTVASNLQKANNPPPPPPPPQNMPPAAPLQNVSNLPGNQTSANTPPAAPSNPSSTGNGTAAISSIALCVSCHVKPKYFDGSKTHPYCGKTCAATTKPRSSSASAKASSGHASSNSNNCTFCHNRPKYSDGTRTHDYCSKACARQANPQKKQSGLVTGAGQICKAPGCNNAAHSTGDYCSMAHKTLAENLCLMCMKAQKMANSHFCSQTCIDDAEKKGPAVLEVPHGHVTFKSVAEQFKVSWRHTGTTCPTVRRVYKIVITPAASASYDSYRAAIEAKGQFVAQGRSAGNENRRWHGTRRVCNLGDKGHTTFCSSTTCSLCSIIRNSYDISLWGKKTGWGRFGKGIYTSSTSSKSNDYSHNDCKSHLKAILLNKVVVGKGCKMMQDNTTLVTPPNGFDSVLAEKGGSLNYDELVVYTNDAIRPSFLVMYDEP